MKTVGTGNCRLTPDFDMFSSIMCNLNKFEPLFVSLAVCT